MTDRAPIHAGDRIRAARGLRSLSQPELGKLMPRGMGRFKVTEWERGISEPPIAALREIGRVLDIPDWWWTVNLSGPEPTDAT